MLRAVPPSAPPERVYQRLKITDRIAVHLVERQDFFQAELLVIDDYLIATAYPITAEVSDGELLSSRMPDLKSAVQAMIEAGFILPSDSKAA